MDSSKLLDTPDQSKISHMPKGDAPNHDHTRHRKNRTPLTTITGTGSLKCSSMTLKENEYKKHIAFHVAGHAAAMYLNNKNETLPPVHFQIKFKDRQEEKTRDFINHRVMPDDRIPFIEGGLLIQSLPYSVDCQEDCPTESNVHLLPDYMAAFEADIINLLAGPLAEAHYVHDCDDEPLNRHLVNLEALSHYDGDADLELIHEYLQNLFLSRSQQDEKLYDLFTQAFNFVKNYSNWHAITQLAEHIYKDPSNIINYEEIVAVLDSACAAPNKKAI